MTGFFGIIDQQKTFEGTRDGTGRGNLAVPGVDKEVTARVAKEYDTALKQGITPFLTLDGHKGNSPTWQIQHNGLVQLRMEEIKARTAKTEGYPVGHDSNLVELSNQDIDQLAQAMAAEMTAQHGVAAEPKAILKDRLERIQAALNGTYDVNYPDGSYKEAYEKLAENLRAQAGEGNPVSVANAVAAAEAIGQSSGFGEYVQVAMPNGAIQTVGVVVGNKFYPVKFGGQEWKPDMHQPTYADILDKENAVEIEHTPGVPLSPTEIGKIKGALENAGVTVDLNQQGLKVNKQMAWSPHGHRKSEGFKLSEPLEAEINKAFGENALKALYAVARGDEDNSLKNKNANITVGEGDDEVVLTYKEETQETFKIDGEDVTVKTNKFEVEIDNTTMTVFAYENGNLSFKLTNSQTGKSTAAFVKGGTPEEEYGAGKSTSDRALEKATVMHAVDHTVGKGPFDSSMWVGQALTHCLKNTACNIKGLMEKAGRFAEGCFHVVDDVTSKPIPIPGLTLLARNSLELSGFQLTSKSSDLKRQLGLVQATVVEEAGKKFGNNVAAQADHNWELSRRMKAATRDVVAVMGR